MNRTFKRAVVSPLAAALVAGSLLAHPARADDWETYQHDTGHTGFTTSSPNPGSLALSWSAPTGYALPQIIGRNIIATQNGQGAGGVKTLISSFQIATGAINWTYSGSYAFASQAAYGNGLVAFTGGVNGSTAGKLLVLNASTGALVYTAPSTVNADFPLLVGEFNGSTSAYLANGNNVQALSLNANSGSVLWTDSGEYGGFSIPTLIGSNTLIVAGPGQYYAINRATGAQNHFHSGNIEGGGGDTVVYDAARSQFYVSDYYNNSNYTLTAYHFGGTYSSITQLWQLTGTGVGHGQVALDSNGDIYSNDNSHLIEIDPSTGAIVRTLSGQSFAAATTPLIAGNDLWDYTSTSTVAYDLASFNAVATLPGSRGSLNTPFDSPGAADSSHFVIDYGDIVGSPGFAVYSVVPEPGPLAVAAVTLTALLLPRRCRSDPLSRRSGH